MSLTRKNLLDLNVLVALTESQHFHYQKAQEWFTSTGWKNWGVCPFTEAGYVRVTTSPAYHPAPRSIGEAIAILQEMKVYPGYSYWEIDGSRDWVTLTAPFASRITGHQQVTDAYLLGLAIKEDDVLVTFDRGLKYLAGPEFSKNLLILE